MEKRQKGQTTGRKGEDIACKYLTDTGHTILERNWRYGHLEIDIITLDKDGIHFVEVKSRTVPAAAMPQESVTGRKQRNIASAAAGYLLEKDRNLPYGLECHFDVAAVTFGTGKTSVLMIPDAYVPGL